MTTSNFAKTKWWQTAILCYHVTVCDDVCEQILEDPIRMWESRGKINRCDSAKSIWMADFSFWYASGRASWREAKTCGYKKDPKGLVLRFRKKSNSKYIYIGYISMIVKAFLFTISFTDLHSIQIQIIFSPCCLFQEGTLANLHVSTDHQLDQRVDRWMAVDQPILHNFHEGWTQIGDEFSCFTCTLSRYLFLPLADASCRIEKTKGWTWRKVCGWTRGQTPMEWTFPSLQEPCNWPFAPKKRGTHCFCNFISREVLVGFDMVSMLLKAWRLAWSPTKAPQDTKEPKAPFLRKWLPASCEHTRHPVENKTPNIHETLPCLSQS